MGAVQLSDHKNEFLEKFPGGVRVLVRPTSYTSKLDETSLDFEKVFRRTDRLLVFRAGIPRCRCHSSHCVNFAERYAFGNRQVPWEKGSFY